MKPSESRDAQETTYDAQQASTDFFSVVDKLYQAHLAKLTFGVSPAAVRTAYFSWASQLAQAPGRMMALAWYPLLHASDLVHRVLSQHLPADGQDVRFHTDNWALMPWRLWAEGFLQVEDWWKCATVDVPGLSRQHERVVSFAVRQRLDALCPANFILTNPDLFEETIRSEGKNLIRGTELAGKDMLDKFTGAQPAGVERYIPGKDVAITPGRVVFQNHLIELIQYDAQTETVYKEPILILPAWIMKYYILDLSPENSMVKWLVAKGHTVFIVAWRNPGSEDRNLSMDDYYRKGAIAAIDSVSRVFPKTKIHLMGYCLGGTLAMITAAALAVKKDKRLKSLTLLAAQGDFTDAGELMLFINQSEVSFLENMMWEQGYLDTKQMAGSFQMLRSYDLIWSKMTQDYLHGKDRSMVDLLAWNADTTRMPYKMHSEYLEQFFLNNDFAAGRFTIEGEHVVAENIHLPAFVVSTEKDHVAPWQSVYKTHLMISSDLVFVLASGGHNAGIVSEPAHPGRSYRIHERKRQAAFLGPDEWLAVASPREGSWWIAWHDWLVKHSHGTRVPAPLTDQSLAEAPGTYVFQK